MDGLIIGVDLCDSYTRIACLDQDRAWSIPTVICKKKRENSWLIGKEAFGSALTGDGIVADKLANMVSRNGTATIEGVRYSGAELLQLFLEQALKLPFETYQTDRVEEITVSLRQIDPTLMDGVIQSLTGLGIPRERVHLISHSESFVYYVLSQKKDVWNNQVGLFDLSEDGLFYHELKVQRGMRRMTVVAEKENMEEGFNLDILDNHSGARLADKILCSCGDRLMKKKLFSAVFLTGKGFDSQEWAPDFMRLLCARRKVFADPELFARGAALKAADYRNEKTSYPFVCVCEGRLEASVSLSVLTNGKESQLMLASGGDNWYEAGSTVELLLDRQKEIEFMISPLDPKGKKLVRISLEDFPDRPNRTTRIEVSVSFLNEKTMAVAIQDKGFGELFPAGDQVIRQEVML